MLTQSMRAYVISGHCTFNAGGQTISAGPGEFIAVPRYAQHSFTVDEPGTQLLNFYLPAGFELFLMGFAHPAERNELPPAGLALPPRHLVEQLSRDYGQIPILGLPGADRPSPDNMATVAIPGAVTHPFSRRADSAPAFWLGEGLCSVLADGELTDGSYCLFERHLPKSGGEPPHVQVNADEMFYMLDGEAEFLLGDHIETASKGALVFIPKGTVHAFRIKCETARFLNLHTPSGFERIVSTLGAPAQTKELPPAGWKAPAVPADQQARLFADLGVRTVAVENPLER